MDTSDRSWPAATRGESLKGPARSEQKRGTTSMQKAQPGRFRTWRLHVKIRSGMCVKSRWPSSGSVTEGTITDSWNAKWHSSWIPCLKNTAFANFMRKFVWAGNHVSAVAQGHLRRRNFNNRPFVGGNSHVSWKVGDSSSMETGFVKRNGKGEDLVEVESSGGGSGRNFHHDQKLFRLSCQSIVVTRLFVYTSKSGWFFSRVSWTICKARVRMSWWIKMGGCLNCSNAFTPRRKVSSVRSRRATRSNFVISTGIRDSAERWMSTAEILAIGGFDYINDIRMCRGYGFH